MIGYFFMSSINISSTLNRLISANPVFHASQISGNLLKIFFNGDGCPEEIEDSEANAKSGNKSKGAPLLDCLIPNPLCDGKMFGLTIFQMKGCTGDVPLQCKFQDKIHLPPPERARK